MVKRGYAPEQTIGKLRERLRYLSVREPPSPKPAKRQALLNRHIIAGIRNTAGCELSRRRDPRNLEKENARFKKLLVNLSLDNSILKEAGQENF